MSTKKLSERLIGHNEAESIVEWRDMKCEDSVLDAVRALEDERDAFSRVLDSTQKYNVELRNYRDALKLETLRQAREIDALRAEVERLKGDHDAELRAIKVIEDDLCADAARDARREALEAVREAFKGDTVRGFQWLYAELEKLEE